jgi:O-acetylhomoserine (thiol)-lyase
MKDTDRRFETRAVHGNAAQNEAHNALRFPVYSGVAFDFAKAEDMELAFTHRKPAHVYSRITNPTIDHFEKKLTLLEQGLGTIALSSGMAALTTTLLAVLRRGDNLVAAKYLFGNTYSLLKDTLSEFGIETRFVDIRDCDRIAAAIDGQTRLILAETISNPQMVVPDFHKVAALAAEKGLILLVDGTVTTPYLFAAKEFGVHVVIHSTTKFISGGATSIGGAIVDLGTYDWRRCPALQKYHRYGQGAFLARLRMEVHRNFGSCMSPQSAYLQTLGLETLVLRVRTSCENSLALARYLQSRPEVRAVNYPGLDDSPYHELARRQFNGHYGGVLSFELENKVAAFRFINGLRLIRRATNINDSKTLVIHPASTIFADCSAEEKVEMNVSDSLVRLSTGIEHIADLLDDVGQAFDS